jgi:hypothetical protein
MKKLVLAALAALCLAGTAHAQGANVQERNGYYFNSNSGQRTNSDGAALTSDVNFGSWSVLANVLNNQLAASGTGLQDSTPVLPTASFKRMYLTLYGTPDSLSTVVRLAVQIRGHYGSNSDSAAAFPWYRWPVSSTTVASTVDSIGHFDKGSYSLAQSTNANTAATSAGLWSGEFLVKFDVARQDTTDGASGLGKFGAYPKGMWIPLVDHGGNPFWAPYTSIRVRVINGVRSRFRIKADLVGQK